MNRRCLIVNPVSNASILAEYLNASGVDCYALIELDKVKKMPDLTDRKRSEFDVALYKGIFISVDEVPSSDAIKFDCVLAGSENGVYLADILGHRLKLTGNDPSSSELRRHKGAMHCALKRFGLTHIMTWTISSSYEISDTLKKWKTYPCIVKPQSSAGGDEVVLCKDASELEAALLAADWGGFSHTWSIKDSYVLQPFIKGGEYVVDMVANNGVYHVSSVCRYIRSDELGFDDVPFFKMFTFVLNPDSARLKLLVDYALKAASALGISNGPVHMELIDSDFGPVMIEAGSRLHGTIAPTLFRHCYKPHLLDQIYNASFSGGKDISSAVWIERGIVCDVLSLSSGSLSDAVQNSLDEVRALQSFRGMQLSVEVGEDFNRTTDLFSSPMNAAFSHEDKDVLWADVQKFAGVTTGLFNGPSLNCCVWERLMEEYESYFQ